MIMCDVTCGLNESIDCIFCQAAVINWQQDESLFQYLINPLCMHSKGYSTSCVSVCVHLYVCLSVCLLPPSSNHFHSLTQTKISPHSFHQKGFVQEIWCYLLSMARLDFFH